MTIKVFYNADKLKEIRGYMVTILDDGGVFIKFDDVDEIIKYTPHILDLLFNDGKKLTLRDYDFFSVNA